MKPKLFAGRLLLIHAVLSFFSFFILWVRHKSLAKAFLILSAGSAIAGGLLLRAHKKDEDAALEALFDSDDAFDDSDDDDINADDAQNKMQDPASATE